MVILQEAGGNGGCIGYSNLVGTSNVSEHDERIEAHLAGRSRTRRTTRINRAARSVCAPPVVLRRNNGSWIGGVRIVPVVQIAPETTGSIPCQSAELYVDRTTSVVDVNAAAIYCSRVTSNRHFGKTESLRPDVGINPSALSRRNVITDYRALVDEHTLQRPN